MIYEYLKRLLGNKDGLLLFKITYSMAFKEGGMASGLLIIAVSIVFAAGFGFLILHFVPGTPF